jgi:hypothetical protein
MSMRWLAGTDGDGDNDEGVWIDCVSYAQFGRSSWREGEFM